MIVKKCLIFFTEIINSNVIFPSLPPKSTIAQFSAMNASFTSIIAWICFDLGSSLLTARDIPFGWVAIYNLIQLIFIVLWGTALGGSCSFPR